MYRKAVFFAIRLFDAVLSDIFIRYSFIQKSGPADFIEPFYERPASSLPLIIGQWGWVDDLPAPITTPAERKSEVINYLTTSKKVSGLFGSKISLQYITVTRFSVPERLMMLCV